MAGNFPLLVRHNIDDCRTHMHETKHLNHVSNPYTHSPKPHIPRTPHQHCRHPRTHTVSQHTHMQHKQQYMHHNHRNNCTHTIGYHDNLKYRPRNTTGQAPHRPSCKGEINLIILQVNINGIKNSRSSNCLFTSRYNHNSGNQAHP